MALSPEELAYRFPATQLAILPQVNPDGCAVLSRYSADGIDLNRDHQLLQSCETPILHRFVRQWQPHVILDLHSYRSRRRHLLMRNLVLDHDVFIDVPTHPAILARPGAPPASEIMRHLLMAVAAQDIRVDRYPVVQRSGRVRHSTLDVVDARNGLALRYGAFSVLLENRQLRGDESAAERHRVRTAQERALTTVLEWFDQNPSLFMSSRAPAPGTRVPVDFNYTDAGHGFRLAARDAQQGQPVSVVFSRYAASLVVRRAVALPASYAVPKDHETLMGLLRRHGFVSSTSLGGVWPVERLRIQQAKPSRRPVGSACKVLLTPQRIDMELDRYEIFPTEQNGGDALAVFLEPESKHGLHRFAAMKVPLLTSSWYPVLRVLESGRKM
jgi:hypothetical protein